MMKPLPVKSVHIFLLLGVSAVVLAATQEPQGQTPSPKDNAAGKRYREQEPPFQPPPIPIQRRTLEVKSGAEHPPSFFESQQKTDKIEARQFDFQQQPETQQVQQNSFNTNFQQQTQQPNNNFQQLQPEQRQAFDQNQFQQQQNPQSFQFPQGQQQQQAQAQQQPSFQDQNNFQSRQQETLPTLPPVFIPPNSPVGPPPQLQSPIRNLFREPEPPFSLAGLFQRFLRLFNINN